MTPQKAILDSKRTLSWFVSYRRLSPPFQLWPLLAVETEVNGTQRVQIKGVLPWLPGWACRASTRDFCSAWAALVGRKKKISSHRTLFQFLYPFAQQAGQAVLPGRLSLSMCL